MEHSNLGLMDMFCFFAGTAFFHYNTIYPLVLLAAVFFLRPQPRHLYWFIAAWLWSASHQWFYAEAGMPHALVIKQAALQGSISSIPAKTATRTQFQLSANRLNGQHIHATLLITCFNPCPDFHAGETWQLTAALKKPRNYANPGGFDYAGLLSSRHIHWIGTLKKNTAHRQSPPNANSLIALREHLAKILQSLVPDQPILGVFEALTLGLTNHLDKTQWDLFRRTGTTHLIDISGEHIALVTGIFYGLFKWFWKHFGRCCLLCPAQKIGAIFAMLIAIVYTLIAGFAVPTQRSLLACCFFLSRYFIRKPLSIWQIWRYGLCLVLMFEPHAVMMIGFYFSFIAVAILILIHQRLSLRRLPSLFAMQIGCLIGLMPLSLYWFSYASINGLVANLFAIPWVGFLIVPLALSIAALSPWVVVPGSVALLKGLILVFMIVLKQIDAFDGLNIELTFQEALPPIALMTIMLIGFVFPSIRLLPAALICFIASLSPNHEKIHTNEAQVDVLDVGQGLAVAVRTAHHVLMYDTGMAFYQGGDIGKSVIIPYLKHEGITKLDKIIISHRDLDHRGGLASLQAVFKLNELMVDAPSFYQQGVSCHTHPDWIWDGVTFHFFPIASHFSRTNNNSCVLQIKTNSGQVLLSGDIETAAETYLVNTYGKQLASTVMLVPHHGSKTSSSNAFIEHIAPSYAIASYGFDNRYHFPHLETLARYKAHRVKLYDTSSCGMVRVNLSMHGLYPRCFLTE